MAGTHSTGEAGIGRTGTLLLIGLAVAIVAVPLLTSGGARFTGTDDAARAAISQVAPGTMPWAGPLWSPPSQEVEGFLFSLQAALGGAVAGYILGFRRGRSGRDRERDGNRKTDPARTNGKGDGACN